MAGCGWAVLTFVQYRSKSHRDLCFMATKTASKAKQLQNAIALNVQCLRNVLAAVLTVTCLVSDFNETLSSAVYGGHTFAEENLP